ncbi:putative transcription factor WD40-like family [Helianthus annuus]|nr:putative transcription factor WD40-like family [Helianthus annuus]KAJ0719249.1 putative transcription factor WD40-like family [Helianthus annuus]KAJ0722487.1 putative transcription factor WD40-like family [Helianthus annuus]
MMASLYEEEEYRFFDARDSIGSVDSVSEADDDLVVNGFQYDVWSVAPKSVHQRKNTFLKFMGLKSEDQVVENEDDDDDDDKEDDRVSRTSRTSGAVLRSDVKEEDVASTSCCNSCSLRVRDSNGEEDGGKLSEVVQPPLVQKVVDRHVKVADTMSRTVSKVKGQLLDRLRSMACNAVQKRVKPRCIESAQAHWAKVQRVKVHQSKKRLKELSAVFIGQDIQAHQGSILTMKFSLDGRYLASGGEDAVVRVWQVVEDDRSNETDIPDVDPSCLYFTVNNLAELAPLMAEKQKISMLKSLKKTKNSACVIFPPKVFRILEKPVHEFRGHKGDVLDLSWSKDNFLLSSSVDETVRLWKVGNDSCLKTFPHSNYVTCVQFQPANENYFISGSIDGKVRIWSVSGCQVVDWIDIREIVTAVAYSPDGKFCPQDSSKVMVTSADSHVRILHGPNVIGKFRGQRNAGNPFCASFTSDGRHIVSANEDSNVYVWDCDNQNKSSVFKQKTVRSYEWFYAGASVALPWSGGSAHTNPLAPCYFSLGQDFFLESGSKGSATWPEEKLPSSGPLCKSRYKFFRSSSQSSYDSHKWGMVIVTAGWDGRIRSFLNYGLPATV